MNPYSIPNTQRHVFRLLCPVLSALLAFIIAWVDRFQSDFFGLGLLRGFGWWFTIGACALAILLLFWRERGPWAFISLALLISSLLVDNLPLRCLGKAQFVLVLVGLSQWIYCQQIRGTNKRPIVVISILFLAGMVIEAVYFLSLLKGRHFVGVF